MNKEQLISSCNTIIGEIERHMSRRGYRLFFMCLDSYVVNVCTEIVPVLGQYGLKHIDGFECRLDLNEHGAFTYKNDTVHGVDYNKAKINHIKAFIKHIEEGGEY